MRPKSMILIIIAMGCGLVASIGISEVIERRTQGNIGVETGQIFITLVDVPIGTALTSQMIKLEQWPLDKIPEGAISNLDDIAGRRPRQPLYAGEPVLQRKLIDPNSDFAGASGRIPKGFRVLSVKVSMDTAASGLILPGDRVDILVYLKRDSGNGVDSSMTKTILTDVTVFAVNQEINRAVEGENSTMQAKTVSLLVKPDQVERLMLAAEMGKLRLSLRRADDDTTASPPGADLSDLNLTESGQRSLTGVNNPSGKSPLASLLQKMERPTPAASFSSETLNTHEMELHTPDGIQRFHWEDPEELPRELSGEGNSDFEGFADGTYKDRTELDSKDDDLPDDVVGGGF